MESALQRAGDERKTADPTARKTNICRGLMVREEKTRKGKRVWGRKKNKHRHAKEGSGLCICRLEKKGKLVNSEKRRSVIFFEKGTRQTKWRARIPGLIIEEGSAREKEEEGQNLLVRHGFTTSEIRRAQGETYRLGKKNP